MKTSFVILGTPIPKARPRVYRGRAVTPPRTLHYEALVKLAAKAARVRPTDARVAISLAFFQPTLRRCDLDNLAKAVLDGLNGVAYLDDSQVDELHVYRELDRDNPRCLVTIDTREVVP